MEEDVKQFELGQEIIYIDSQYNSELDLNYPEIIKEYVVEKITRNKITETADGNSYNTEVSYRLSSGRIISYDSKFLKPGKYFESEEAKNLILKNIKTLSEEFRQHVSEINDQIEFLEKLKEKYT